MPKFNIKQELLNVANKIGLIKDYVVECGSKGLYHWKKWASGEFECWGTHDLGTSSFSTRTMGEWYQDSKYYYDYIVPFDVKTIDYANGNHKNNTWSLTSTYTIKGGCRVYYVSWGGGTQGGNQIKFYMRGTYL